MERNAVKSPNPAMSPEHLEAVARRIRSLILRATGRAGSGHPTSSLSAVELMTTLMFGGFFYYHLDRPDHPNNDRLIFSKGHASSLYYALWTVAGAVDEEELMAYRTFDSPLEGHPSSRFPYAEAMTGSLGQGLCIGLGMALNAKALDHLPYRTWVLLGDGEMTEGSQWEAMQGASHYGLDNLVGVLDVNRLGQTGETMVGHDLEKYRARAAAFGWHPILVDGHSVKDISTAFEEALEVKGQPSLVIARTVKGRGISFLEGSADRHGKVLRGEELELALAELGEVDPNVQGDIRSPSDLIPRHAEPSAMDPLESVNGHDVATRTACGNALVRIAPGFPHLICLDGDVSDSTQVQQFREAYPDRFFQMYMAEQNMVGAAMGLARRGKLPFVSSFGAFLGRAFDQVRMNQYFAPNLKYIGSHAGVSIGEDGPSQMGLEDIALFRSVQDSVVLYPCDAISCERLVERAARHNGMVYLRMTRNPTPGIYTPEAEFQIGGSSVLRSAADDVATVVAAGVTVHEALAAWESLAREGISIRVVDLYSIKPLDCTTLELAARETGAVITVEDHRPEGGLGEAVAAIMAGQETTFRSLAVRVQPRSGTPRELMAFAEIDREAIMDAIKECLASG